jgi:hypothetical protein
MTPLINVTENMVASVSPNTGNFMSLFDSDTTSFWFAGWGNYPSQIVIDLQTVHQIDKLRIYDGAGSPTAKFEFADSPMNVHSTVSHVLTQYMGWTDIAIGKAARFVYVTIDNPGGDKPISILEIYGISTGSGGGSTTPTLTYGEASQAICTNSFHWVPIDIVKPFAMVREYNYWSWYEGKQGVNAFEPSAETGANLDKHFAELKANNITPLFCLNQCPPWLNTYKEFEAEDRPTDTPTSKSDDPASYSYFARFMYQIAARYGRVAVPLEILTLDASNTPKSGLNLLEFISPWNEPDKWWKGPRGNIKANEYAALLSAVWDGHEGTIKGHMGIKNADPSMKVVLGGLTDMRQDYLNEMNNWFKTNRKDKKFCADVIDVHHYSGNYGTELFSPTAKGVAPETDSLKSKVAAFVNFTKMLLPNREIWMTEYGYDTGTKSPQRSTAYGGFSADEVQAMWNIRSFLEILAGGMDKAFVFNIYDESNDQFGIFQTSGVVRSRADGLTKKMAWNKFSELATKLKGLVFKGDESKQANVRNYKFANDDGSKVCLIMWSPTENGTTIPAYVYGGKSYFVSEMPSIVEVSATAGGTGGGTVGGANNKKVLITLDDTNKVGSKTTHEMLLAAGDELWVNGVKVTTDVLIVVKRAASPAVSAQNSPVPTPTATPITAPIAVPTALPPTALADTPQALPPSAAATTTKKKTTTKKTAVVQ